MHAEFGAVRIEWLRLADESLLLFDLSVETGREPAGFDAVVVAPGRARARAVVLTDLAEFEAILDDRSVIAGRDYFDTYHSDRASQARKTAFGGIDRPVVVTPWPKTTLTLLIGHVAGFVFDDAALLSHLPIILRENQVPAVRASGATSQVCTGDLVEIGSERLHIVGGQRP